VLTMGKPLKVGGTAWQYLVDNVGCGVGEGAKAPSYYAGQGTPPGRFVGRRLTGLGPGPGTVKPGDVDSPEMLYRMLVQLADPVTGDPSAVRFPSGARPRWLATTPALLRLEPPYEELLGPPSYEVCLNCGFEFGNDDNPGTAEPLSFEYYRAEWEAGGRRPFDG
jgi:hypothetical protein